MVIKIDFLGDTQEIDDIPQDFDEFVKLIQNMFGYTDFDKMTFEYTLDNKDYILLYKDTYTDFYNNHQNAHIYIHFSLEETNAYRQENGLFELNEENNNNESKGESENNNNNIIEEIKVNDDNINDNDNINKIENNIINEEKIKEDEVNYDINLKEENSIENNNINEISTKENNIENNNINEISTKENNIEEENNIKRNNYGIKLPEITKEMVIQSMIRDMRQRRQESKIQLEKERKERKEKLKKEKEKKRKEKAKNKKQDKKEKNVKKEKDDFAGEISNMINSRVEDFKKEIINGSKMKLSQIILSQSQMNIKNDNESKDIHSLETHPGISCCKCGMNPIIGNRYCCIQCDNVNFCDKCEEEIGLDHGHPLYKFKLRIE